MPDHASVQRQIVIEAIAMKICRVQSGTIQQWRYRGRVPDKHRLPIAEAAAAQGCRLTTEDFDRLSVLPFRPGSDARDADH